MVMFVTAISRSLGRACLLLLLLLLLLLPCVTGGAFRNA
jgi:hypothetical protein